MPHEGLVNSFLNNKKKEVFLAKGSIEEQKQLFTQRLITLLMRYPIDAFICGHNHIYDRCVLSINQNEIKKEIPVITLGFGTHIKTLTENKEHPKGIMTNTIENFADNIQPTHFRISS